MILLQRSRTVALVAIATGLLTLEGCTWTREYVQNGFKVGPNYHRPPAPVEQHWIDASDKRVREDSQIPCRWWRVFNDPVLNEIVANAYCQNLSLREAGFRILEARAQLGIARGELFPQVQNETGSYMRRASAGQFFDQWNFAFNLAWELDLWGRFRRAVIAADDTLQASVADYDDVLVTLLGDLAANYVTIRTDQERIRLLQENIDIQQSILNIAEERLRTGTITSVDVEQVRSNLLQNQSSIEQLEIDKRQAENRLCILVGIPPRNIEGELGAKPIPTVEPSVAVGIPANLICRRPDIRRAERQAAAQSEQIGIAIADLYPAVSVSGTWGYTARTFGQLFTPQAFNGSIGPSFQWNILNYGRITNNVFLQDARFQELVAAYQNTVLQASSEVENGLVAFLRAQRRAKLLADSSGAASKAVLAIRAQLDVGRIDFNQYAVIQQSLITQQDLWAQARGEIAQGLIQVYRALGGGWELRCQQGNGEGNADGQAESTLESATGKPVTRLPATAAPSTPEEIPTPQSPNGKEPSPPKPMNGKEPAAQKSPSDTPPVFPDPSDTTRPGSPK